MLLIPFVENAFKHQNKAGPSPGTRIHLTVVAHQLLFEITNHLKKNFIGPKGNIGGVVLGGKISKDGLEILYAGKYTLQTITENNIYRVKLWIQI